MRELKTSMIEINIVPDEKAIQMITDRGNTSSTHRGG